MEEVFQKLDEQMNKLDAYDEQDEFGHTKRGRKPPSYEEYVEQV